MECVGKGAHCLPGMCGREGVHQTAVLEWGTEGAHHTVVLECARTGAYPWCSLASAFPGLQHTASLPAHSDMPDLCERESQTGAYPSERLRGLPRCTSPDRCTSLHSCTSLERCSSLDRCTSVDRCASLDRYASLDRCTSSAPPTCSFQQQERMSHKEGAAEGPRRDLDRSGPAAPACLCPSDAPGAPAAATQGRSAAAAEQDQLRSCATEPASWTGFAGQSSVCRTSKPCEPASRSAVATVCDCANQSASARGPSTHRSDRPPGATSQEERTTQEKRTTQRPPLLRSRPPLLLSWRSTSLASKHPQHFVFLLLLLATSALPLSWAAGPTSPSTTSGSSGMSSTSTEQQHCIPQMSPLHPPVHCGPSDPGVWATCHDHCRKAPVASAGTTASHEGASASGHASGGGGSEPYATFIEYLTSHGAKGVSAPKALWFPLRLEAPTGVQVLAGGPLPAGAPCLENDYASHARWILRHWKPSFMHET